MATPQGTGIPDQGRPQGIPDQGVPQGIPKQGASTQQQGIPPVASPPTGNFGIPHQAPSTEESINRMANADKLTQGERKVYGILPGVSTWMDETKLRGVSIADRLEKFNNGWMGKALQKLDVLAEGFERTSGLVAQMAKSDWSEWDRKELSAAWYAGSLTADMTNLPQLAWSEDGKVAGLTINADLPGSTGLANARADIMKYVNQGMSYSDALSQVRDDYYTGLGALQLRASVNDMTWHMLADPVNLITAYLKPVQALKARRISALAKIGGEAEVLTALDKTVDLIRTATKVEDKLAFTDEAFRLSQLSGKVDDVVRYTDDAVKITNEQIQVLKKAGKADEVVKLQESVTLYKQINKAYKSMSADDAAQFAKQARLMLGKEELTQMDRFAIFITGGDPFRPSEFGKKFAKVPILGKIAKEFKLTPESQAKELMTLMADNYRIAGGRFYSMPNAEKELADYVTRIGKGATGIEYGHSMMTVQGRTVQAFSAGVDTDVARLFSQYDAIKKQRQALDFLAETLGDTPSAIIRKMKDNPQALLEVIAKKSADNPDIQALMQAAGLLDPDALKSTAMILEGMPRNKDMFFATVFDAIETHAMRQAVTQFGVKEKGLITRWSDAIKSAESLAFLKLNPGYPIRNKINNDLTMMARGVFGYMTEGAVDDYWKSMDLDLGDILKAGPTRLGEDITPIGQATKKKEKVSNSIKVLEEALSGGNYGSPEAMKKFFDSIELGNFDMAGTWGQRIEQKASKIAMTKGMMQGLEIYARDLDVTKVMGQGFMRQLDEINPGIGEDIRRAVISSNGSEKKFNELIEGNLNLTADGILDDIDDVLGTDAREMLGDEVLALIRSDLPSHIEAGTVDKFIANIQANLERHVDDLAKKQIDYVVEHTKAQVAMGGPNVYHAKAMEMRELFYGSRMEYAQRMPYATQLAREATLSGDWKAARALWEKEALDSSNFHRRLFDRMDAMMDGMEAGVKHLDQVNGVKLPFKVQKQAFKEYRNSWESFYKVSNDLKRKFFEQVDAGKKPKWDDLQIQLDEMYKSAARKEDEVMYRLDQEVSAMIDDVDMRKAYMKARDELAELQRADRSALEATRKAMFDAPPEERAYIWNEFWKERNENLKLMQQVDKESIAIQQADPASMAKYADDGIQDVPGTTDEIVGTGSSTKRKPEEVISLAKEKVDFVEKHGDSLQFHNARAWLLGEERALKQGIEPFEDILRQIDDVVDEVAKKAGVNPPEGKLAKPRPLSKREAEFSSEKILKSLDKKFKGDVEKTTYTVLPSGLEKASPSYSYGSKQFNIKFEDDVDKAIYIVSGKGKSASHAKYEKFLEDLFGTEAKSITNRVGKEIRDELKSTAKASEPGELSIARKTKPAQATTPPAKVEPAPFSQKPKAQYIADYKRIIVDQPPIDMATDQVVYGRMQGALDQIVDSVKRKQKMQPRTLKDLPPELQGQLKLGLQNVRNEMAGNRYKAMKYAEWRRDSALLNYNRRTNFDNQLAHVAPFVFWSTSSMFQWAVESIDRPAMFTNYLRIKKFMETAGVSREGMASRTKGKLRIKLPFAPDWMGEQFVDPLRMALPFDNWASPFEQLQRSQQGMDGQIDRVLQQQVQDGTLTQEEYEEAVAQGSGPAWDYAEALAKENQQGDNSGAWDFATQLMSPHAPIMWAYNAAFGDKQDIGPFAPISRTTRNAMTMLGVEDWNNSKWNIEAKIRKQMGLPAFDKWDSYRIKRMASSMAGDGTITPDDAKEVIAIEAMVESGKMTVDQAKQSSEVYAEAVKRANKEFAGGGWGGFIASTFGFTVTSVAQGELNLRDLQNQFTEAIVKGDKAEDDLQKYINAHPEMSPEDASEAWAKQNPQLLEDSDALGKFFEENPEYETRLGLFDTPEEQIQKFFVDQMWKTYMDAPDLHKKEIREHLGDEFQRSFLSKETRSLDSVPMETLAVWMKMANVDPLGGLTADQQTLVNLYGKVQFTAPETAQRLQVFYDNRKAYHADFYKIQSEYYKIQTDAGRKAFKKNNPQLQFYWDWRRSFMNQNPDLVPYMTDNEKDIEKAKRTARGGGAVYTQAELQQFVASLPPSAQYLINDALQTGEEYPEEVYEYLEAIAGQRGMTPQQAVAILNAR